MGHFLAGPCTMFAYARLMGRAYALLQMTAVLLLPLLACGAVAATLSALDYPSSPCDFNAMCTCAMSETTLAVREVRCVGVPFGVLPDLPPGPLAFVELLNSGLQRLDERGLRGTRVQTLRLMSNRITWIDPGAFRSVGRTLSSLDLSFNQLYSLPSELFHSMTNVTFINLYGNMLHELRPADWRWLRRSLSQAFLGENELRRLAPGTFGAFERLVSLNLDSNLLRQLPASALPAGLQVLTANNNQLQQLPVDALRKLHRLNRLQLRGNAISRLPSESVGAPRRLVELHLSQNRLEELPGRLFNGSVRLRDLHLQYNLLTRLRRAAFAGLHLTRLFLAHNRVSWIDDDAFHGVRDWGGG
ncbi:chaoptin-like [Pollicipes pollicipes]|uniref:chaoptin-like n=1 Tax=Pollicipes pollicipes TaxID=41117 RepID=UPI001885577C|nr:chaoptin-like [Pollicipes pollicipes]